MAVLAIISVLTSCVKSDPQPSGKSDTNATYYISAMVNGKKVVANENKDAFDLSNTYNDASIDMQLRKRSADNQLFEIMISDIDFDSDKLPITILPGQNTPGVGFWYEKNFKQATPAYDIDGSDSTSFTMKLTNRYRDIIEGTFSGTLYASPSDSVVIKDGKFKIQYETF